LGYDGHCVSAVDPVRTVRNDVDRVAESSAGRYADVVVEHDCFISRTRNLEHDGRSSARRRGYRTRDYEGLRRRVALSARGDTECV